MYTYLYILVLSAVMKTLNGSRYLARACSSTSPRTGSSRGPPPSMSGNGGRKIQT